MVNESGAREARVFGQGLEIDVEAVVAGKKEE
jgi:hypothetical protein